MLILRAEDVEDSAAHGELPTSLDELGYYTNYGDPIDVAAPGGNIDIGTYLSGEFAVVAGLLASLWILVLVGVAFLVVGGVMLGRARREVLTPSAPARVRAPIDGPASETTRPAPPGHFFDPSQSSWSRRAEAWRREAEARSGADGRSSDRPGLGSSDPTRARPGDLAPDDIIDIDPE